ncbi:TetR/AcrR family transcriptional regulator [Hoyosella altamirensis]|uniref:AcrR family transcriptional regulator n=1 Tax=Hoyosella altamirensis TaxID=616997 RepID=A0A839RIU2_9ACTN|nr:TetR/AcrR family transcriptional regulator [Hoyosella altamirensis]MBB3036742.1 AcrR family transcriptional regulator [Hoyosella altamirensis]
MPQRTKAQQRDTTARALLGHARRLFAERGYAHVSLNEIATAAGVTKGGLYHHFSGKDALFEAVMHECHLEVAAQIESAAPHADAWTQLIAGCQAFLTASTEPGLAQIMLIDAPSVIGWHAWRGHDAATSMRQLETALAELMDTGVIVSQPVAPIAHLLSGAMNEAALWLAHSDNRVRDLSDTISGLTRLLESLRTTG